MIFSQNLLLHSAHCTLIQSIQKSVFFCGKKCILLVPAQFCLSSSWAVQIGTIRTIRVRQHTHPPHRHKTQKHDTFSSIPPYNIFMRPVRFTSCNRELCLTCLTLPKEFFHPKIVLGGLRILNYYGKQSWKDTKYEVTIIIYQFYWQYRYITLA